MIDLFNPREETEEVIENLNLDSSIGKVRKVTEAERESFQFAYSVDYAMELTDPNFPVKRVYLGLNGTCYYLGDGKIFFDPRRGQAVAKHEMIHAWYDSLNAEQQKDVLDAYMQHEPDFLGGRERTGGNPLISYRDVFAYQRRKTKEGFLTLSTDPLTEEIGSLEKAVAMTEGEYVDCIQTFSDGKSTLVRLVKTNDTYRASQILDEADEGFAAWLKGEKDEFLAINRTADEYFAYQAMYNEPTMPAPIYEAMKRNGFDNDRFEQMSEKVMDVVKQLCMTNPEYANTTQ